MRERCYTGVWSNGKRTIDLDNLNTVAEMESINACCFGGNDSNDSYYATEAGTIVHTYTIKELEDWYADTGGIYSRKNCYEILGKNFKKIKDKGEEDPNWVEFNRSFR